MSDVFTVDERSRIMSRIRSSNTSPECMMAAILRSLAVDFESGSRELKGKPDFIIKSCMIAIFCDGDFWHGHSKIPDIKFWRDKMENNRRRDIRVNRFLNRRGWSVLRFRESVIMKDPHSCAARVLRNVDKRKARSTTRDCKTACIRIDKRF